MLKILFKLLLYKITPVKKNYWVFTSFNGHYSDSPKYISEKVHEFYPDIKINWLVKKEYMEILPAYCNIIDIDSFQAEKAKNKACIIIDNVYGYKAYSQFGNHFSAKLRSFIFKILGHKRRQYTYTVWHGMPGKKIGCDQPGNNIQNFICNNVTMFTACQLMSKVMENVTFHKIPMVLTGFPRNDLLFQSETAVLGLKAKLGLPNEKKIVLFAPTFRNDGPDVEGKNVYRSGLQQLKEIDFEILFQTLSEKFGGEWVFVCRFHYHVQNMVDWEYLSQAYNGRVINGNLHDDMAEYLACTDVLLTDASSCCHDFSLTHKPCFLFFPDYDNYRDNERGFYVPFQEYPYPLSENFQALIHDIKTFDLQKYKLAVDQFHRKLGFVDDGTASERVLKFIMKDR